MPTITMRTTGPIFDNPNPIVRRGANHMIKDVAQEGEGRLDQILRPRPAGVYLSVQEAGRGQASTGNYRRHLQTTFRDRHARIDDGNVIYGPWLEGTGSRNASTHFKGYSSFRKTAQWLRQQMPRFVNKWAGRIARDMGG